MKKSPWSISPVLIKIHTLFVLVSGLAWFLLLGILIIPRNLIVYMYRHNEVNSVFVDNVMRKWRAYTIFIIVDLTNYS